MEKPHHSTALVPSNSRNRLRLQVAPHSSRSRIPQGWGIEVVPRPDGSCSDTYYYEPETGRKFRSIKEVERHLDGSSPAKLIRRNHVENFERNVIPCPPKNFEQNIIPCHGKSSSRKMVVSGAQLLRLHEDELGEGFWPIVASEKAALIHSSLPDGWIIEDVPRKYHGRDRYYYEPGMRRKFRSMVSVERYLAEMEEDAPLSKLLETIKENKPLSKVFKLENRTKNPTLVTKDKPGNNSQDSSFGAPPMKVDWVLTSPQGEEWMPFVADTMVPDSMKQQWSERFHVIMKDGVVND